MAANQDKNTTKNLDTISRAPVVVIMGHIDHGKTTLLDYIRHTHVAAKESGAITQHIGAYEAIVKANDVNGTATDRKITFLDTPGHEAFSEMRSRGAQVADIAVLVINVENIKKQLADNKVFVEDWGGEIPVNLISAKEGKGVEELLDLILLLSDMENLTTDLKAQTKGIVIESWLDKQRGNSAVILMKNGILKQGDDIATVSAEGKAKIIEDFKGENISSAQASMPVRVTGFDSVPLVGEEFYAGKRDVLDDILKEDRNLAKQIAEEKSLLCQKNITEAENSVCLAENIFNFVIKSDVDGSLEPITSSLDKIAQAEEVKFNYLKVEVGDLNETDVKLAFFTGATVIAFRVKEQAAATSFLSNNSLKIFKADILYQIIDFVTQVVQESKNKNKVIEPNSILHVLQVFNPVHGNQLVGGEVTKGCLNLKARFDIMREEKRIGQGKIINLQHNKGDVDKVECDKECGIVVEAKNNLIVGDDLYFFNH
ncbi:MAG: GTP-binding protein [Candidatus Parcubacteria bacterium]|nr:GTP-binding protein [Candidatus Parcubacteria bacterium]